MERTYMVAFVLTKTEMNRILSMGDLTTDDFTEEKMQQIVTRMAQSIKENMLDEPHYAFEDYIEGKL